MNSNDLETIDLEKKSKQRKFENFFANLDSEILLLTDFTPLLIIKNYLIYFDLQNSDLTSETNLTKHEFIDFYAKTVKIQENYITFFIAGLAKIFDLMTDFQFLHSTVNKNDISRYIQKVYKNHSKHANLLKNNYQKLIQKHRIEGSDEKTKMDLKNLKCDIFSEDSNKNDIVIDPLTLKSSFQNFKNSLWDILFIEKTNNFYLLFEFQSELSIFDNNLMFKSKLKVVQSESNELQSMVCLSYSPDNHLVS